MERAHWQLVEAELRARIKFLNGERKSQEVHMITYSFTQLIRFILIYRS